jgi:hypothetical protein
MIVIQHPVADYEAWKKAFDADPIGRARNGVSGHAVFRSCDDPNDVMVTLEFATRADAEKFMPALREMWRRVAQQIGFGSGGGVQARIVETVERVTY